ncbi:uncharacterized protein LOC125642767 [Caretta caretta]|uniref:uncharacterized protein LOC125642767 n=1 Tax=Caretta caretta TaxID=8467 RepID=UPI003F4C0D29
MVLPGRRRRSRRDARERGTAGPRPLGSGRARTAAALPDLARGTDRPPEPPGPAGAFPCTRGRAGRDQTPGLRSAAGTGQPARSGGGGYPLGGPAGRSGPETPSGQGGAARRGLLSRARAPSHRRLAPLRWKFQTFQPRWRPGGCGETRSRHVTGPGGRPIRSQLGPGLAPQGGGKFFNVLSQCGHQKWTQYSRNGLTNDVQR